MDPDPRVRDFGSLTMRSDGILHAVFDFDMDPSMEAVAGFVEARRELIGPVAPPALIEIVKLPYVERHIRSFFMAELNPPPCRAVVATNPSYATLFRSFQLVDPSNVPTELFRSIEPAIEWIRAQTSGKQGDSAY